jgi:hypothetical protein
MATTGSITAGSNQLVVADVMDLQIGEGIIIEIGGEAGAGARGTRGVGGAWPALSYANAAAMNADTSQVEDKWCWLEDTGVTYFFDNATTWTLHRPTDYYNAKAVPKALWAKITNISGNTLTLDTTATVTTTNANVYFDNWPVWTAEFAANRNILLSAGTYYSSDYIPISTKTGLRFKGAGEASLIKTPNGASHGGVQVAGFSDSIKLHDIWWDCGFTNTGYGMRWSNGYSSMAVGGGQGFNEVGNTQGAKWGECFTIAQSDNCEIRRCVSINPAQVGFGAGNGVNNWAYNCEVRRTDALRQYIQWMILWYNSTEDGAPGGTVDCSVDSNYLVAGIEAFGCVGCEHIRFTGRNAVVSNNASEGTIFDTPVITIEENSQYNEASFAASGPIININANIGPGFDTIPVEIINPTIIQEGAINVSGRRLRSIVVNADCPPVEITGTYDTDFSTPKGLIKVVAPWDGVNNFDGLGVDANTATVTISGIRFRGPAPNSYRMVLVYNTGAVVNLTDVILDNGTNGGGSTYNETNVLTNAAFDALHPGLP